LEEALWYINGIFEDKGIKQLLSGTDYKYLIISEENYDLLLRGLTIEAYEIFFRNLMANRSKKSTGPRVELIGDEKALEDLSSSQQVSDIKEGDNLVNAKQTVKPPSAPPSNESTTPPPPSAPQQAPAPQEENPVENPATSTPQETPQEEKEEARVPVQTETENVAPQAPQPPKELKKYKGLYTYDEDAPHYFVIIVPKGDADFNAVRNAIEKYNSESQALLNLRVTPESGKNLPQMFVVGVLPNANIAKSYLLQVVKDEGIKAALEGIDYRNIVISQDNLNTLKTSGNLTVYMELFRHFYLK